LRRAWGLGAGPSGETMTIDMDSTICEVHGHAKQGAAYGYTRKLGYHPLLATLAETGEVLHARLRKGSSQRGTKRFVEELIARVRRAGATAALCLRADGGFWSHELIDTLVRLGVGYSITVRVNKAIRAAIEGIEGDAWVPIAYPDGGEAAVAETTYTTGRGRKQRSYRLVVRRSRLTDPAQAALWPDWRYHAFVTSSTADAVTADRFHRDHARVELAIRDLKEGAGLEHCPSGRFFANAAWLACAVLAHNIARWTDQLGGTRHGDQLTVARTVRARLIALPGRLVNRSGRPTLRLPLDWPWATAFTTALGRIRNLPLVT
jgi:Transposase DDE domain group 1